nr:aminotransferase class I/II-fold pyridoxal phosphate-dependent enzyme [Candidatus Njordarchaeum guaymaensis]
MIRITDRVMGMEYAIRDVLVAARQLEKQGKKILYFNIGDPVAYGFETPEHVRRALYEATNKGYNGYADSQGVLPLREAVCEREKRVNGVDLAPENVIVTSGTAEGINFLFGAIVESGDEILVPGPAYPQYISVPKFYGGKAVTYRTIEEEGWKPDLDDLRKKIRKRTRAVVLINPNNPTGAHVDESGVKEIVDIVAEHRVLLISDEIYDQLVFERKGFSTAAVAKDVPMLVMNGVSKTYVAPGWRIGWMCFHHPNGELNELKDSLMREARIRLSANAPCQYAAAEALRGPQDHIPVLVEELKKRRDVMIKRFNEIPCLSCVKPEGAFYAFPKITIDKKKWKDDKDFVLDLLKETGVLFVYGSGFDPTYGSGHFRTVILPPIEMISEAMNKLQGYMQSKK